MFAFHLLDEAIVLVLIFDTLDAGEADFGKKSWGAANLDFIPPLVEQSGMVISHNA
jgi:hypothetical protein